jgi:hypothetical protein
MRHYTRIGMQHDSEWQRVLDGELRAIGAAPDEAMAANDHRDWAAVSKAVCMF